MSAIAPAGEVVAELTYTVDNGQPQINESYGPGNIYQRTNGSYGMELMCCGGGLGTATVIERLG